MFFFSNNLLDLSDHVIHHALNCEKYDHLTYKIDVIVLEKYLLNKRKTTD